MTAPQLHYHKEVNLIITEEGKAEFEAFLNQQYIGTFPLAQQAWAELDAVAYEDARRSVPPFTESRMDQLSPANPLIPFGVAGGPTPEALTQLTPADIGRAAESLADFYERHPAVVKRIISAYDYALAALTGHTLPDEQRIVRIRENGDIAVRGSKIYWVSDSGCTCPDFRHLVYGQKYAGSGAESGLCKHALCRELLRLAQARAAVGHAGNGNPTAFTVLPAIALTRALNAAAKAHPADIRIELACYRARISAGKLRKELVSATQDGWGFRALTISHADAALLGSDLNAFTNANTGATITLLLDGGTSPEVAIFANGFARNAPAVAEGAW